MRKLQVICPGEEGQKAINNSESMNEPSASQGKAHSEADETVVASSFFLIAFCQMRKVRPRQAFTFGPRSPYNRARTKTRIVDSDSSIPSNSPEECVSFGESYIITVSLAKCSFLMARKRIQQVLLLLTGVGERYIIRCRGHF